MYQSEKVAYICGAAIGLFCWATVYALIQRLPVLLEQLIQVPQ